MEGNKELRDPQATQSFWNARWENRQTGWDIGYASPALTQYIDGLTDKDIAILIPGCGNAYEASYLIARGFSNITLIDIAPIAVANAQEKFKDHPEVKVILGNFFELEELYDLILEQTFFCAIDPSLRPQYIQKMASLLKPSGRLVGVLFNIDFEKKDLLLVGISLNITLPLQLISISTKWRLATIVFNRGRVRNYL